MRSAEELGILVRDRRRALDLTQQELAERARVTRQWVARLEHGHQRAELDPLLRTLCELDLELCALPAGEVRSGEARPAEPRSAEAVPAEAVPAARSRQEDRAPLYGARSI
jgi:HTH-type transcriptional regulator / antitoxin HipB